MAQAVELQAVNTTRFRDCTQVSSAKKLVRMKVWKATWNFSLGAVNMDFIWFPEENEETNETVRKTVSVSFILYFVVMFCFKHLF